MLHVEDLLLPHKKRLNLTLEKNSVQFVQGPNGSGKSLALKSLATFFPATFKKFDFNGKSIESWNYQEYRSLVTYCSPVPWIPMTGKVEEFMKAPFTLQIRNKIQPTSLIDTQKFLHDWKLTGLDLAHLSSGQRQGLALLRAMTMNSEILLLDEVFSHLDRENTLAMEEALLKWQQATQGTLLMVSHDIAQPIRMGGRVLHTNEILS